MIENSDSTQPNECTESCPANYYIDKKNKTCNKYKCENGFINPNNFECMETCNVPINPSSPNPTNGEGYIYKDNERRSFCYPSCFINGTQMHYLFGDNKCFENECKYYQENENGITNPKYSAFNNSYVCYNSCELIGYNYQSDYICYSKPILCDEPYYYMENGLKKCASYNDCKDKYHFNLYIIVIMMVKILENVFQIQMNVLKRDIPFSIIKIKYAQGFAPIIKHRQQIQ